MANSSSACRERSALVTPRRRRALASLGALAFCVAIVATPKLARAQSPTVSRETRRLADEHVRIGVSDFNARLFEQAAREFEVAYGLDHDPRLLSNIGNARYESGDFVAARDAFRAFLSHVPNAPNRAVIEARLQHAIDMIEAASRPSVAASGSPAPNATATPRTAPNGARIAGIILAGVGAASIVTGAVLYANVDGLYRSCEAMLPEGCAVTTQPRAADAASVALLWGGSALAIGGAVLAIFAPSSHPAPDARVARHARIVDLGFAPGSLFVRGEF
jgi:hypothetical protein